MTQNPIGSGTDSLSRTVKEISINLEKIWIALISICIYVTTTLFSVTHKDLIMSSYVKMPIFDVKLPLVSFVIFSAILFLSTYLYFINTLELLSAKIFRLISIIKQKNDDLTTVDIDGEASIFIRYFFQSNLNTMQRCATIIIFNFSYFAMPCLFIIFLQVRILPLQDLLVTWTMRIILILTTLGSFFFSINICANSRCGNTGRYFSAVSIVNIAFILLSVLVFTFPGEFAHEYIAGKITKIILEDREYSILTNRLIVRDEDLKPGKDAQYRILNLNNRSMRNAILDGSDFSDASLKSVDLRGSSVVHAILKKVDFSCVQQWSSCSKLEGVDFTSSDLTGANLEGANLDGASMEATTADDSIFTNTSLIGADFRKAYLYRSHLDAIRSAKGASFDSAHVKGAFLLPHDLDSVSAIDIDDPNVLFESNVYSGYESESQSDSELKSIFETLLQISCSGTSYQLHGIINNHIISHVSTKHYKIIKTSMTEKSQKCLNWFDISRSDLKTFNDEEPASDTQ